MAKPTTRKKKPGVAPRPQAPEDNRSDEVHDLQKLADELPHPGDGYRAVMLGGTTEGELVVLGQSYTTDDILATVPRFAGAILEQKLTAAQRKLLIGYSPEKLALLVHEAVRLAQLNQAYQARAARTVTQARADLRRAMSAGIDLRDTVERTLAGIIPPGTPLRTTLEQAHGDAKTAASLARTLRGLADVADGVRVDADAQARKAIEGLGITDELAAELRGHADDVVAKEAIATGTLGPRIEQRELDYQDGVVLTLLSSIYRAFQYAHERSPKLVVPPLGSVKRLVKGSGKRAAPEEPPVSPKVEPSEA